MTYRNHTPRCVHGFDLRHAKRCIECRAEAARAAAPAFEPSAPSVRAKPERIAKTNKAERRTFYVGSRIGEGEERVSYGARGGR